MVGDAPDVPESCLLPQLNSRSVDFQVCWLVQRDKQGIQAVAGSSSLGGLFQPILTPVCQ